MSDHVVRIGAAWDEAQRTRLRERLAQRMKDIGFALPYGDERLDQGSVAYNVALAAVTIEAAIERLRSDLGANAP